jgi:hypothetical protein
MKTEAEILAYRAETAGWIAEIEAEMESLTCGTPEFEYALERLDEAREEHEWTFHPYEEPEPVCGSCGGEGAVNDRWRGAGVTCLTCGGSGRAPEEDGREGPLDEYEPSPAEMDAAADRHFAHAFRSPY